MCGQDAHVCICSLHISDIVSGLVEGVNYIEHMLYQQLYAAVGKEVTSADFAAFNKFHNRKVRLAARSARVGVVSRIALLMLSTRSYCSQPDSIIDVINKTVSLTLSTR